MRYECLTRNKTTLLEGGWHRKSTRFLSCPPLVQDWTARVDKRIPLPKWTLSRGLLRAKFFQKLYLRNILLSFYWKFYNLPCFFFFFFLVKRWFDPIFQRVNFGQIQSFDRLSLSLSSTLRHGFPAPDAPNGRQIPSFSSFLFSLSLSPTSGLRYDAIGRKSANALTIFRSANGTTITGEGRVDKTRPSWTRFYGNAAEIILWTLFLMVIRNEVFPRVRENKHLRESQSLKRIVLYPYERCEERLHRLLERRK